jgi:hypothetical protein
VEQGVKILVNNKAGVDACQSCFPKKLHRHTCLDEELVVFAPKVMTNRSSRGVDCLLKQFVFHSDCNLRMKDLRTTAILLQSPFPLRLPGSRPALTLCNCRRKMVGLGRVELPTNGLGNRCSIHLSYRPAEFYRVTSSLFFEVEMMTRLTKLCKFSRAQIWQYFSNEAIDS